MSRTLSQQIAGTQEGRRLLQQEDAILEVTELICEIMEEDNVSRSQLAHRLGKTKGYITQLLDGSANMTIRTIADVFGALGRTIHFGYDRSQRQVGVPQIRWNVPLGIARDISEDDIANFACYSDLASAS